MSKLIITLTTVLSLICMMASASNNVTLSKRVIQEDHAPIHGSKELEGKWFMMKRDNDDRKPSEHMMEGKYIQLTENGDFVCDIEDMPKAGKWAFDEETQVLSLNESKWKLERLNEFGLVLINQETKEKWALAAAA